MLSSVTQHWGANLQQTVDTARINVTKADQKFAYRLQPFAAITTELGVALMIGGLTNVANHLFVGAQLGAR